MLAARTDARGLGTLQAPFHWGPSLGTLQAPFHGGPRLGTLQAPFTRAGARDARGEGCARVRAGVLRTRCAARRDARANARIVFYRDILYAI